MVSPGDPHTETTPESVSKLNFMTLISGTGAELAALDKTKHRLVTCTSTGSGFTLDHVYLFSTDGTTAIDLSQMSSHTHTDSTDGGSFERILSVNSATVDLLLTKTDDLKRAQWIEVVSGTGSIEDKTDGTTGERSIRLRPNGTSGSGATISYPHLKLDFSKTSSFNAKLQVETATNIAFHTGIRCDNITSADSNNRKYQAEVCTVTNNNWFLRTADGTGNSASDSGIAFSANRVGISMDHNPTLGTPRVDLYVDAASAFQKTTNIPISGNTADDNLIRHSVKNSTGADRPLLVYGTRVIYTISDNWVV